MVVDKPKYTALAPDTETQGLFQVEFFNTDRTLALRAQEPGTGRTSDTDKPSLPETDTAKAEEPKESNGAKPSGETSDGDELPSLPDVLDRTHKFAAELLENKDLQKLNESLSKDKKPTLINEDAWKQVKQVTADVKKNDLKGLSGKALAEALGQYAEALDQNVKFLEDLQVNIVAASRNNTEQMTKILQTSGLAEGNILAEAKAVLKAQQKSESATRDTSPAPPAAGPKPDAEQPAPAQPTAPAANQPKVATPPPAQASEKSSIPPRSAEPATPTPPAAPNAPSPPPQQSSRQATPTATPETRMRPRDNPPAAPETQPPTPPPSTEPAATTPPPAAANARPMGPDRSTQHPPLRAPRLAPETKVEKRDNPPEPPEVHPPATPSTQDLSKPALGGELTTEIDQRLRKISCDVSPAAFDTTGPSADGANVQPFDGLNNPFYKYENTHVQLDDMKLATYAEGDLAVGYKNGEQVLLHGNYLYVKLDAKEIANLGILGKDGQVGKPGWYMKEPGQNREADKWRAMPAGFDYFLNEKTGAFISQKEKDQIMYFRNKDQKRFDVEKNALGATVRISVDQGLIPIEHTQRVVYKQQNGVVPKTEVRLGTVGTGTTDQPSLRTLNDFTMSISPGTGEPVSTPVKYVSNGAGGFKPESDAVNDNTRLLQNVHFAQRSIIPPNKPISPNGNMYYETNDDRAKGTMTILRGDCTLLTAKSDDPNAPVKNPDVPQFEFDDLGRISRVIPSDNERAKGAHVREFAYIGNTFTLAKVTVYGNNYDAGCPRDSFGQALNFVYERQGDDETWSCAAFGNVPVYDIYGNPVYDIYGNAFAQSAWINDQNNQPWPHPPKGKRILDQKTGDYTCTVMENDKPLIKQWLAIGAAKSSQS